MLFMETSVLLSLVLTELERVLALRLPHRDRPPEVEAQRLEQATHALVDGLGQRPVTTDEAPPCAAPHGFLDDAVSAKAPERDARDRHGRRPTPAGSAGTTRSSRA